MSDESSQHLDVADQAREMREHERRAQEHDSREHSPANEQEAGESYAQTGADIRAAGDADDDPTKPAPPTLPTVNQ